MPTIELLASGGALAVTAEAPAGGALIDVCDEAHAPVPFSCRGATCGTCLVHVVRGAELLEPALEEEAQLLASIRCVVSFAPPGGPERAMRLACQARLRPGPGLVTLLAARERSVADGVAAPGEE